MKIFGQPESYSDMLQRIFYTNVASGLICTLVLANASPAVKAFLDSLPTEARIGPLESLKALYVLIPIATGVMSRMLRLHDVISNIFRIRFLFDTRYLLFPLAKLSGHDLTRKLRKTISNNRVQAMRAVFYAYASFKDPIIDTQLVRTAADNWGWFWVLIESSFIFGVTAVIFLFLHKPAYALIWLVVILVQMLFLLFEWFACQKSAKRQVEAILEDNSRRTNIHTYFSEMGAQSEHPADAKARAANGGR